MEFSDLKYERPNFEKSSNIYQELMRQMNKFLPDSDKIKKCFADFSEDYINFISMYNLCSILGYIDKSEYYSSEYLLLSDEFLVMQSNYNEVFSLIADLNLRFEKDTLEHSSIINQARRTAITYGRIDNNLIDQENSLIKANRDYLRNISIEVEALEPGTKSYLEDQTYSSYRIYLDEFYNWLRQGHADTRAQIYYKFSQKLEKNYSQRESAFKELVKNRRDQSEQSALSYFDLVTSRIKGYGYPRQKILLFKKYLNEYFLPIIEEIKHLRNKRLRLENPMFYNELQLLPDEQINLIKGDISVKEVFLEAIKQILGEEESYIDKLIEGNFWTSDPRLKRELERDVTLLPKWDSVYLTLSLSRPAFILEDDFYSVGKALADLSSMINLKGLATFEQTDIVRKIAGLSMMFFSARKMDLFAGENSALFNDLTLSYELLKIPLEMAVDTFETTLYSAESNTDLTYSNLWKQIEKNNNIDFNFASDGFFSQGHGWQLIQRLYDKPFSSLNRVMALVVVLAERPHQDRRNRLERKLNNLLTSNTDLPFLKRIQISGFSSPFELDTIRRASFTVCDILQL